MKTESSGLPRGADRAVLDWLLEPDQPAVRRSALADLVGRSAKDPDVQRARARIAGVGWAPELLASQNPKGFWEPHEPRTVRQYVRFLRFPVYRSSVWQGIVLADLGLAKDDARIRRFADRVFQYLLPLSSPLNIYTEEVCFVGNMARMLTRFGYGDDRRVRKLYDWMIEDQRADGGWNCAPGKPGTLDAWEALAAFAAVPKTERSAAIDRAVERGAEFYLDRALFHEGRRYAPWFRFHYPVHYYYDVLVGLDVLTELGYGGDRRLQPALRILTDKRRRDGTWAIDRIHPDRGRGGDADRRDTKPLRIERAGVPSKWITLTALRILRRVQDAN